MKRADEILRVYEPHECDEQVVPLDWECCRACIGAGENRLYRTSCPMSICHDGWCGYSRDEMCETCQGHGEVWVTDPCGTCDGHGSLKAAALAYFRQTACAACGSETLHDVCAEADRVVFGCRPGGRDLLYRCQICGHPMSEGIWKDNPIRTRVESVTELRASYMANAERILREGREPRALDLVHYSPCDEKCRHGGPLRCNTPSDLTAEWDTSFPTADADVLSSLLVAGIRVEASWRSVDVRTLGWPHDLRVDHLAVLCLRCFSQGIPSPSSRSMHSNG